MKPFIDLEKSDTGCCPGHDDPPTRRWSGQYSSVHSKRSQKKAYDIAKRNRRHRDKQRLILTKKELDPS